MERKNRKIYYTMGEVSEMFDVNPSLIRFWEQKFDILKPDKNKKGNRLFTPKDVENLKLIYHLVKENGMTLAGAAKRLRDNREGVERNLEIIEKLQGMRALLLEVREELKSGGDEIFIDMLDIEMPSNGFQMAQTLTQMEKHPLVIFVTKRHEYAVQGYGIAFRYLVKPLDESLFAAAMDAVVQELDSKHFTVEYEGATLSLETSDIYYLESHGHKVLIHCKGQDLTLRMTIPEALEQLPKRCFASPHKSYLVNMEHIVYATGTAVVLSSGNQLPISRRKRQEFNQNFNAYLGR